MQILLSRCRWFKTPWRSYDVSVMWKKADNCISLWNQTDSVAFGIWHQVLMTSVFARMYCHIRILEFPLQERSDTTLPFGCNKSTFCCIVMTRKYMNVFTLAALKYISATEFKTNNKTCCKDKRPRSGSLGGTVTFHNNVLLWSGEIFYDAENFEIN